MKKGPPKKNYPVIKKYQKLQLDAEELNKENEKNMIKLDKLKQKLMKQGLMKSCNMQDMNSS